MSKLNDDTKSIKERTNMIWKDNITMPELRKGMVIFVVIFVCTSLIEAKHHESESSATSPHPNVVREARKKGSEGREESGENERPETTVKFSHIMVL